GGLGRREELREELVTQEVVLEVDLDVGLGLVGALKEALEGLVAAEAGLVLGDLGGELFRGHADALGLGLRGQPGWLPRAHDGSTRSLKRSWTFPREARLRGGTTLRGCAWAPFG
ncbi:MAG: hypothetical protein ACK56I_07845, partial [bacterium]